MSLALATNVSFALNYASMATCSLSIIALLVKRYRTKRKENIQVRFGFYLVVSGLFYSGFQNFNNSYSNDDFLCGLSVWGWFFFQNLCVFYTMAISHNISEIILRGKLKEQTRWENIYFYVPIIFSMILIGIPWIVGEFGYSEEATCCWILGDHSVIWQLFIGYLWVIIACIYSLTVVFLVMLRLLTRSKDRSSVSTTEKPKTQDKINKLDVLPKQKILQTIAIESPKPIHKRKSVASAAKVKAKKEMNIAASIFKKLAPYPIILIICQASSVADLVIKPGDRSIAWNVFDLSSSAIQGLLYAILVLRNPDLLSFDSSASDTLDIILGNNELTNVLMSFLKTLLCEENLEFYLAAQDFKYAYLADELINTFTESARLKQEIYEKYFKESGTLNIPHDLQKSMQKTLTSKEVNYTMFDEVMKHVKGMISSDSMPKFIKSDYYKEIEEKIRFEKIKRKL